MLAAIVLAAPAVAQSVPEHATTQSAKPSQWETLKARMAADGLYLVSEYDETRDPEADLAAAFQRAAAENKRVLLEVGGDWCTWCRVLDVYMIQYSDVRAAFRSSFVMVKINYSTNKPNTAFLSRYPKIKEYPHFFVLGADGALLESKKVASLQGGTSFSPKRMLAFARKWGG